MYDTFVNAIAKYIELKEGLIASLRQYLKPFFYDEKEHEETVYALRKLMNELIDLAKSIFEIDMESQLASCKDRDFDYQAVRAKTEEQFRLCLTIFDDFFKRYGKGELHLKELKKDYSTLKDYQKRLHACLYPQETYIDKPSISRSLKRSLKEVAKGEVENF